MSRYLIAIGSPFCEGLGLHPLPNVQGDVERVTRLFSSDAQRYRRVLDEKIEIGAPASIIYGAVLEWFADPERELLDQVVIYYAG